MRLPAPSIPAPFVLAALIALPSIAAVPTATGPENFLQSIEDIEGFENVQAFDESTELPGWRLRTGAFYSDNITRVEDDPLDELVAIGEFGANWHTVGNRFAAAFDGNIAYREYTRNDFDDEGRGNFLAVADFFIVPETLDWYVADRLANAPVDPLRTTSPINVQFVNVLETGPRLTLRPGAGNEFTLAVSRADINAQESPIDHDRRTGNVAFMRDITSRSRLGIVAEFREIEFDESAAVDFDQETAHLNFESSSETVDLQAAVGQSRFELADGGSEDETTGWVRIRAQRTSSSSIYAAIERTAHDTATAMLRDELLLDQGGVDGLIVTGDPFFADYAVVRYVRGWRAHDWFLSLNAREIDYFASTLDRKQRGVRLGTRLSLTRRILLSVTASRTNVDYTVIDRSDSVQSLLAEFDYRVGRDWSILTGAQYLDRESDDTAFEFNETVFSLFARYAPQRGSRR